MTTFKASTSRIINGQIYNDLDITSGGNIGFTVGVLFTDNAEVEFLWNRQFSTFSAGNPAPSVDLADLSVDNFEHHAHTADINSGYFFV